MKVAIDGEAMPTPRSGLCFVTHDGLTRGEVAPWARFLWKSRVQLCGIGFWGADFRAGLVEPLVHLAPGGDKAVNIGVLTGPSQADPNGAAGQGRW